MTESSMQNSKNDTSSNQMEDTMSFDATASAEPTASGTTTSSSKEKGATTADITSAPTTTPEINDNAKTASNHESMAATANNNKQASGNTNNEAILKLVKSGRLAPQEVQAVQGMANDHAALKVKVDRLKGLLGRSAKAQREAKVELEVTQKRLDQALRDVQRLKEKVDHLSTRPTHLDLLNDFETNFDRALLSVGQTGGQDTAAPVPQSSVMDHGESAVDAMLMQELEEARNRLAKLESLNGALMQRASHLEADARERKKERDEAQQKLSHMELELRMAKMEAAHAQRAMEEKAASLEEMQMEIDLVTKASVKANVRAAHGEAVAKSSKTDRQHIIQLEAQVQALKEWALASAESKRLALERVSLLEKKLKNQVGDSDSGEVRGKIVFTKSGSLVVGAGDVGYFVVEVEDKYMTGARLLLRWKFDSMPNDCTTYFNIMKGKCQTSKEQAAATYLIKDRVVTGGAAGELEGLFTDQNICTLLWSNSKSWIRPRTVKFTVEVTSS